MTTTVLDTIKFIMGIRAMSPTPSPGSRLAPHCTPQGIAACRGRFARCVFTSLALLLTFLPIPARADPPANQLFLPLVRGGSPPSNADPVHHGIATWYGATGAGACLFDPSPSDLMVTAINAEEWNGSAACGTYMDVTGPSGSVRVRVVDLCPECKAGHLDLAREAFARIADPALGQVDITWQVVSPELTGPIVYHFKDGSNPWWTAVQVRNHRNPIARLEYLRGDGQWVNVPRTDYNYFVQTNPGMGTGPFSFRATDVYGNVLADAGIPHAENKSVPGAAQFPPGP